MFDTEEEKTNYERARDLKDEVNIWVEREFNFIQLEVYEKCNEYLFEHIRQEPVESFLDEYMYSLSEEETLDLIEDAVSNGFKDIKEYLTEEKEDDVREWVDENHYSENYPVWSTLFEFKSEPPESWITAAQEVGLGVIDPQEAFKTTLFATSAGHSFYSSYWIPLYLAIFEQRRSYWANVDFSMV